MILSRPFGLLFLLPIFHICMCKRKDGPMAETNSRFSRLRANESKLGAYYTDVAHCRDLRKLFRFPEDEVCVLEPCIGDASAVISITDATNNPNIKIFGVELNNAVAKQTKENPQWDFFYTQRYILFF